MSCIESNMQYDIDALAEVLPDYPGLEKLAVFKIVLHRTRMWSVGGPVNWLGDWKIMVKDFYGEVRAMIKETSFPRKLVKEKWNSYAKVVVRLVPEDAGRDKTPGVRPLSASPHLH